MLAWDKFRWRNLDLFEAEALLLWRVCYIYNIWELPFFCREVCEILFKKVKWWCSGIFPSSPWFLGISHCFANFVTLPLTCSQNLFNRAIISYSQLVRDKSVVSLAATIIVPTIVFIYNMMQVKSECTVD